MPRIGKRLLTRLADCVTLAIIAAATMIGSIMPMGVEVGPRFGRGSDGEGITVDEVLGYFGLGTGVVLAFRLVAGIVGEARPDRAAGGPEVRNAGRATRILHDLR